MARTDRDVEARGLRDEANVGPDPRQARDLTPLRDLDDYKVADGEPDIRGWRVFTSSGRELGRIDDLLVDTESGEVVMLDVDLRRNDRHTLAPIRAAWIDREHERVILDSREIDSDDMVPTLARGTAATDEELRQFGDRYDRAYGDRGYDETRDYDLRRSFGGLHFGRRRDDAERELRDVRDARAEDRAELPPAPSEEARRVNETLASSPAVGAAEAEVARRDAGQRRGLVERWRGERELRREERDLRGEREQRQREVDAANAANAATADERAREEERRLRDARAAADRRDRQVHFPTTTAPADVPPPAPPGRIIEEVVVRRREVGPDERP